jgi:CRP-like cAMP-binding protein
MDLDLNKFRTLIPINALYENNLMHLARQAESRKLSKGEIVFRQGDKDQSSVFLLSGSIELISVENEGKEITAGSIEASYAIAADIPRKFDAVVTSDTANIVLVNKVLLDRLLAWGETTVPEETEGQKTGRSGPSAQDSEWMMAMLQTETFQRLPAQNIQALFTRMDEIKVSTGDVIVNYGEDGGYYYMVKMGRCQVSRPTSKGSVEILAEIGRGSSFGEESLISNAPRNATITMLTDGILMRLSKQDFIDLYNEPIQNLITTDEALKMCSNGACLLDVRLESEYQNSHLPGALSMPLSMIREKGPELDSDKQYILYCDTGQRSSTAAFLLSEIGLDVCVIEGGMTNS